MATIDLADVLIQTPQPYNASQPTRNQEIAALIFIQIVDLFKQEGPQLDLPPKVEVDLNNAVVLVNKLEEILLALKDLRFNGQVLDLGFLKIVLTNKTGQIQV